MKTLLKALLTCDSYYVTVDWDTATPLLKDWIHIL